MRGDVKHAVGDVLTDREALEALLRGEEVTSVTGARYAMVDSCLCRIGRGLPESGALLPYFTRTGAMEVFAGFTPEGEVSGG